MGKSSTSSNSETDGPNLARRALRAVSMFMGSAPWGIHPYLHHWSCLSDQRTRERPFDEFLMSVGVDPESGATR